MKIQLESGVVSAQVKNGALLLNASCPHCGGLSAFYCRSTRRIVALGRRFVPEMAADCPTIDPEPHPPPEVWQASMVEAPGPWVGEQRSIRRAIRIQCARCKRVVLAAEIYGGVFGPDEDQAVGLRCRVYGAQDAPG
jgi:hypothetical protein